MLTKEEEEFLTYWEQNRLKHRKTLRQFMLGIPVALLFIIPIAANFLSGWNKRAAMVANAGQFNPLVLLIALLLITGFVAIFSRRFRWERNEQKYLELKAKASRQSQPDDPS
jgi:hypothetical protein